MFNFSDRIALKADQVRRQVLKARRLSNNATAGDLENHHFGRWATADALQQRLTILLSLREAIALVRVIGSLDDRRDASQISMGGPVARFLAALHVARQAVLRQPNGGVGVVTALAVLRLALDELERSYDPPISKKPARRRHS